MGIWRNGNAFLSQASSGELPGLGQGASSSLRAGRSSGAAWLPMGLARLKPAWQGLFGAS